MMALDAIPLAVRRTDPPGAVLPIDLAGPPALTDLAARIWEDDTGDCAR